LGVLEDFPNASCRSRAAPVRLKLRQA